MAELDKIPQTQSIQIATAKIEKETFDELEALNQKLNSLFLEFGQIYMRKKEIQDELIRLDDILEKAEDEFKMTNAKIRDTADALDEQYPQGRINMQDGTIQYQPGAPTRKQLAEMQRNPEANTQAPSGMKVVKE